LTKIRGHLIHNSGINEITGGNNPRLIIEHPRKRFEYGGPKSILTNSWLFVVADQQTKSVHWF